MSIFVELFCIYAIEHLPTSCPFFLKWQNETTLWLYKNSREIELLLPQWTMAYSLLLLKLLFFSYLLLTYQQVYFYALL